MVLDLSSYNKGTISHHKISSSLLTVDLSGVNERLVCTMLLEEPKEIHVLASLFIQTIYHLTNWFSTISICWPVIKLLRLAPKTDGRDLIDMSTINSKRCLTQNTNNNVKSLAERAHSTTLLHFLYCSVSQTVRNTLL